MTLWWWGVAAWAGAMDASPSLVGEPGSGPWAPALGDLDGDGVEDLLIGLPYADRGGHEAGLVAFVSAPQGLPPLSLLDDAADAMLVGDVTQGNFGYAVTITGDRDGDGLSDFAASAPNRSDNATASGVVFVGWGGTGIAGSASTGDERPWGDLERLLGTGLYERVGMRMWAGSDLDGDGRDELLVGTPAPAPGGSLFWGWLGLVPPMQPGDGTRSVLVEFGADPSTWVTDGLDTVWLHEDSGSLAGRAAAVLPDVDGDGRKEVVLGAPGVVDPDRFDPYELGTGAVYLFAGQAAGSSSEEIFVTDDDAIGTLVGVEAGDAFPWNLLALPDGRLLASSTQTSEGSGAVYLVDELVGQGQRYVDEAAASIVTGPARSLFGHGLVAAEGHLDGALWAAGAPGAMSGAGSVFVLGELSGEADASFDALGRIDGCWTGGQAGYTIASTPSEAGMVLAITAPFASVHGERDGLVAIVGPDSAAWTTDCASGDYTGAPDEDGDGHDADVDCDDSRAYVHPDAVEVCGNALDDDCDGETDEDCGPPLASEDEPSAPTAKGCSAAPASGGGMVPILTLVALAGRRRRSAALVGAAVALGLSLSPPALAQGAAPVLDAFEGASHRLWGSDPEERLLGPVRTGWLTGGAALDVVVANPYGIQGNYSNGEVQILTSEGLGQDVWLGQADHTIFGDAENITLGASMLVVDEGDRTEALYVGIDFTGLGEKEPGEVAVFRAIGNFGNTASNGSSSYLLTGEANADSFGSTMGMDGDLDGDGLADLVIGAPTMAWRLDLPTEPAGCASWEAPTRFSGAVYILHGGLDGHPAEGAASSITIVERDSCAPDRVVPSDAGATAMIVAWDEDETTWFGWRLLSPGDLDGDGLGDLVVGSLDSDLGGTVHLFAGPIGEGELALDLDDAVGSLTHEGSEAFFGWGLAVSPEGGLAVSSPFVDQGSGRVWLVDTLPRGAQDVEAAASLSVGGEPGSGFGYSLAWGEVLLVGAPYEDRVHVLDQGLQTLHVLGGAAGLGTQVGFIDDISVPADGVPEAWLMASEATGDLLLQGVALLLDGQRLIDGELSALDAGSFVDLDGDGVAAPEDCEDLDPRVVPGAEEVCNGVDDDCDGQVDEDACGSGCAAAPGRPAVWGLLLLVAVMVLRAGRSSSWTLWLLCLLPLLGPGCRGRRATEAPQLVFEDLDTRQELDPDQPLFGSLSVGAVGEFERMVLLVDGEALAVADAQRVQADWEATSPGDHEVVAIGYDDDGQPWTTLQLVRVDPAAGDSVRPRLILLRPISSELPAWVSITLAITGSDDHLLDTVSVSLNEAVQVRWSNIDQAVWASDLVLPGLEVGRHLLVIEGSDHAGNTTTLERTLNASLGTDCSLVRPETDRVAGTAAVEVEITPSTTEVGSVVFEYLDGEEPILLATLTEPAIDEHGYARWGFDWDSSPYTGTSGSLVAVVTDPGGQQLCREVEEIQVVAD